MALFGGRMWNESDEKLRKIYRIYKSLDTGGRKIKYSCNFDIRFELEGHF